jgi:hypothetical protein
MHKCQCNWKRYKMLNFTLKNANLVSDLLLNSLFICWSWIYFPPIDFCMAGRSVLRRQERKRHQPFWPNHSHSSQIFCVRLPDKYHLVFCIGEACYWFRRLHILLWTNGSVAYAFYITACLSVDRARQVRIYIPIASEEQHIFAK